jgi:predicted transcriptional regulator
MNNAEFNAMVIVIVNRLKAAREALDPVVYSQTRVADMMCITQPALSFIERTSGAVGKIRREFSLTRFVQMCLIYHIDPVVELAEVLKEYNDIALHSGEGPLPTYLQDWEEGAEGSDYV